MIQPAGPSVASSSSPISGILAENGGQSGANAGFAEVLAGQPQGSVATAATALPQPNLAAILPEGGKVLPGALPDMVAGLALQPSATDAAPPAEQGASPAQAIPTLLAAMRAIRLPQSDAVAARPLRPAAPETDPASPDESDATRLDPLAALAAFAAPAPLPSVSSAASASPGASLPPLIEAQMLGRPLPPQPNAPTPATPKGDDALALKLDPAAAGTATPAIAFAEASAAPAAGVRLRPVIAEAAGARTDLAAPALDGAGLLASPIAQPLQNVPATLAGAPVSGAQSQDFAQLMDRLIAARDAAQTGLPQNVQIAVKHADFGPISVSFQQDQHGLAVSVASPDPEFARAVQAAIPAPTASTGADSTGRDGSGRDGTGQNGQAQGFARADASGGDAGQRGARQARFDPDGAKPAANPSTARADATPASRPRGVFA